MNQSLSNQGITHANLGPIWYLSESSDVPYSTNQTFLLFLTAKQLYHNHLIGGVI